MAGPPLEATDAKPNLSGGPSTTSSMRQASRAGQGGAGLLPGSPHRPRFPFWAILLRFDRPHRPAARPP